MRRFGKEGGESFGVGAVGEDGEGPADGESAVAPVAPGRGVAGVQDGGGGAGGFGAGPAADPEQVPAVGVRGEAVEVAAPCGGEGGGLVVIGEPLEEDSDAEGAEGFFEEDFRTGRQLRGGGHAGITAEEFEGGGGRVAHEVRQGLGIRGETGLEEVGDLEVVELGEVVDVDREAEQHRLALGLGRVGHGEGFRLGLPEAVLDGGGNRPMEPEAGPPCVVRESRREGRRVLMEEVPGQKAVQDGAVGRVVRIEVVEEEDRSVERVEPAAGSGGVRGQKGVPKVAVRRQEAEEFEGAGAVIEAVGAEPPVEMGVDPVEESAGGNPCGPGRGGEAEPDGVLDEGRGRGAGGGGGRRGIFTTQAVNEGPAAGGAEEEGGEGGEALQGRFRNGLSWGKVPPSRPKASSARMPLTKV